jgi:hypothetical protein
VRLFLDESVGATMVPAGYGTHSAILSIYSGHHDGLERTSLTTILNGFFGKQQHFALGTPDLFAFERGALFGYNTRIAFHSKG